MKLAVLSPVAWRTPPRHYGPWEQIASNIAEGMLAEGIEVTLFATADSETGGKLRSIIPRGYEEDKSVNPKVVECMHISYLMEMASEFDLIHNNFDFLPLTYTGLINTPVVTTIHGFSSPTIVPVYKKYNNDKNYYVSISNADRSHELDYIATVYNGIDKDLFTFRQIPQDYLLYFGRIHPEKGLMEAIQIAKKSGRKLLVSGIVQDERYFHEIAEPHFNNEDIVYLGSSGPEKRDELLGNAYALLHPISFNEPFGLSVAEAMFCGTPVVAFNRGSMPELISDGKTGFLVNTVDEAVDRLRDIPGIDRSFCRRHATDRFSREKMIRDYLEVYKQIISGI